MKLAIVHDYLNQSGGAERVVAALHRLFPEAPIYTTIADPAVVQALMPGADVRVSWMQRLPARDRWYRGYVMLYPGAIESLDLSGYDVILSSSSAFAKGAIAPPGARHICYCHTPMRFAWDLDQYAAREQWSPLVRRLLPPLVQRLRRWDLRTAQRPTRYLANSSVVAQRIARNYGLPSRVVPPPVEVDRFVPSASHDDYYLIVSRLVGYKRIDLAVEAFTRMARPLMVIGDGPARAALERNAGPSVRFLGRLSDWEVAEHYARCRAVIFPGEEDFGIVPLEANAAGRPVIACRAGGALDTVIEGSTGLCFFPQSVYALCRAVEDCERIEWDPVALRRHAEGYREEIFRERILAEVSGSDFEDRRTVQHRDWDGVDALELTGG